MISSRKDEIGVGSSMGRSTRRHLNEWPAQVVFRVLSVDNTFSKPLSNDKYYEFEQTQCRMMDDNDESSKDDDMKDEIGTPKKKSDRNKQQFLVLVGNPVKRSQWLQCPETCYSVKRISMQPTKMKDDVDGFITEKCH